MSAGITGEQLPAAFLDKQYEWDHHPNLRGRLAADIFNRAVQYMQSGRVDYGRNILLNLKSQGCHKTI